MHDEIDQTFRDQVNELLIDPLFARSELLPQATWSATAGRLALPTLEQVRKAEDQ